MTELDDVVAALQHLRQARAAAVERKADVDQAVIAVWRSGVPKRQVAGVVQQALAEAGWAPDEITAVPVSNASIRLLLNGVR